MINTDKPEIASGNLENREEINQSSNNSQSSSTGSIYEPETLYPQKWATGDGTAENPWANDCINKALDFVPVGGTIYLKAGYYTLSTILDIGKQVNIIGEGRNKSIIVLGMTDTQGIYMNGQNYITLKGFTIDGDSQIDGTQYISPISIGNCDYITLEDIEVMNAGYYGINIHQVNHSLFQNIYAHDNYRHGLHPGSDIAGRNKYNTYRDIYAWNNGFDGFNDRGSTVDPDTQFYNVFDNLQCWDNERFGITICNQRGGVLSNSFASGSEERGMHLENLEGFSIDNCLATLNGSDDYPGIYLINSENVNFTNVIVKNNYSGIEIRNCSNIKLTSCLSYDDRETPLQRFGLELTLTANTDISLVNCKLSPNSLGEIYNPAGVVVTVITEKMLAKF
jgi:parallel beta-helix repeat protein